MTVSFNAAALGAAMVALCLSSQTASARIDDQHLDLAPKIADGFVERVARATARFKRVEVAIQAGYAPIPCVSGANGGAMGIHYVNAEYLSGDGGVLSIGRPEALMYEPQADGNLDLVGVEYITFAGPGAIGGQLLEFHDAPNRYGLEPFYELHVWAHRHNPNGEFAAMNPEVSCAHARMAPTN